MKKVSVILKEYQPNATESERVLVSYLIDSPQEAVTLNILELAKKTFCSPATIVRLCKKVKLGGYKRLHRMMMSELLDHDDGSDDGRNLKGEKVIEDLVNKVTLLNIDSLRRTKELLNINLLEECARRMVDSDKLVFFGEGSSYIAGLDAQHKLLDLAKASYCPEGVNHQMALADIMSENDVAIVMADEIEESHIIKIVRKLKENQVTIFTITRLENSSLSRMVDFNLNISSSDIRYGKLHSGSRISIMNVVDILYILCAQYQESKKG